MMYNNFDKYYNYHNKEKCHLYANNKTFLKILGGIQTKEELQNAFKKYMLPDRQCECIYKGEK